MTRWNLPWVLSARLGAAGISGSSVLALSSSGPLDAASDGRGDRGRPDLPCHPRWPNLSMAMITHRVIRAGRNG